MTSQGLLARIVARCHREKSPAPTMRLGLIADVKQAFHQMSIELGKEGGGTITFYKSSVWLYI